jgi:hypothetical protein
LAIVVNSGQRVRLVGETDLRGAIGLDRTGQGSLDRIGQCPDAGDDGHQRERAHPAGHSAGK